ncbi:helix-turn-helix domain-containing protein [Rhizobium sp. PRIMUS64]|uniref:helix-turn-helix domain-containing protein n=2 Tax=Rhizobium/Agrobacterium group TaxID=227290 RepID=UPI001FF5F52D|nr:helix-turn-helix transcriptional regulator [Rhizobium sp. PRIMUS64]MCJ9691620.1 helix-turn-helix domain-containing protein [Rhizobium sp. PRIMUS64]
MLQSTLKWVWYQNSLVGNKMPITGFQIKAARSLIGMEQVELAAKAGVSANTIRNMEAAGAERISVRTGTLDAVTDALKAAGVLIIDQGPSDGGAGVRLISKGA